MARVSVGLEIGTDLIKAVELIHRRKGYELKKLARVKIPSGKDTDTQTTAAKAIEDLFKKSRMNTKEVISGVGGNSVIVRKIEIPSMTEKELRGAIRWEAEQYIPYPIDQVFLGFHILDKEEKLKRKKEKMSVILVGVKRELINNHLQVLQKADIFPKIIDANPLALFNIYKLANPEKVDGIALIEIGHDMTDLVLLNKDNPFVVRSINIGGLQITKAIAGKLNIDYAAAEEIKEKYGLLSLSEEEVESKEGEEKIERQVDYIIKKSLSDLVEEIARSFEYYSSQTERAKVKKIILSGGSSLLKNIDKFLSAELGLPVRIFNPFNSIIYNPR
ncbi:MAG: type IV pilus assembly protein PilM, partial [Candidatus Aerophobetes bacterium]|nr:type IV pilus assembly protein PilM [Candidatus Aerophobetes bacterium]